MDSDLGIQNRVEVDLELLIQHIDTALSATVTDKSCHCDKVEDGMQFPDFVQPATSGFFELLQGRIEEGSKLFSNQKSLSLTTWATDARTVAVDVLRGVSNIHWSAVGLLAVAIVLERLDKISSNDRECLDLLREMNDLAKCIKQLQEIKAHLHKEIRERMSEGVYLIDNHWSDDVFMLSTKIREELNFLRGQVDHMFRGIMLQVQLKTLFTCISYTSLQSTPEAPGGIPLQPEKDVVETSNRGQIQRNAISFNSQQTNHSQPFYLNHGHSSQIASHGNNNHYQKKGIISRIVRGIRGSKRTVGAEKNEHLLTQQGMRDLDHALFPYHEIQIACQDFHPKNKLGEGGFGCVYKGILADGYMAPEYKFDGRVTDKVDVFSFGVVVLEIVSGRRHLEFNSFLGLVKWAWNLHEGNRHFDLVDSRLICSGNFDPKIAFRVILIALQCTQEVKLRPSMSKVSFLLLLPSEEIGMPTLTKPDYLYNS